MRTKEEHQFETEQAIRSVSRQVRRVIEELLILMLVEEQ